MGIEGLVGWARKAQYVLPNPCLVAPRGADVSPEAFTSFPKRWAAPEIKGKRVAIDATLMTNRFHFGTSADGDMRGKGAIVGWYNLISLMRAHKVQPIAIWDKPGKRAWKELETRKRLYTRAQHLARRAHEENRSDRLYALRDAIADFREMSKEEQGCVQDHWIKTRFLSSDSPSLVPLRQEEGVTKSGSTESDDPSPLDNVTNAIDAFSEILRKYRRHVQSTSGKGVQPNDPTLEHIRELEDLEEELGPSSTSPLSTVAEGHDSAPTTGVPEDEGRTIVDDEIQQTLGTDDFPESKTQFEMTMEEGEIIISILTPSPSLSSPIRLHSSTSEAPPMRRLDSLIGRLPLVKAIYERALSTPSAGTHAECRELLDKMGVPVLLAESPFEAEGLAAALARSGKVDFVGTEDSDVIAYEAPLLKNVTSSRLPLELLSPQRLRRGTKLGEDTFLDFCVLCGTDASPRIPGIGPKTAYTLLKKYGTIEAILEREESIRGRVEGMEGGLEGWMGLVRNARELFRSMPPMTGMPRQKRGLNEGEMERWLEERHGISLVEKGSEEESPTVGPTLIEGEGSVELENLPIADLHLGLELGTAMLEDLPVTGESEGDEGGIMSDEDWRDLEEASNGDPLAKR